MEEAEKNAIYLFCFARAELLPDPAMLEIESLGVKTGLSIVSSGGVAAVFGLVPLEDFTGPDSESRFRDLEWIGPRALFHEKTIEEIAKYSPVFPAPFGAIYLSEKNLETYTRSHAVTIASFLDYVSDKNEWAVKAYYLPEQSRRSMIKKIRDELDSLPPSPGARYLHEQRLRASMADRLKESSSGVLAGAKKTFSRVAEVVRERTPYSDTEIDPPAEMVANWALLVAKSSGEFLADAVEELNKDHRMDGIFFRLSGPWPPFSFAPPLVDESEKH